jgi:hypothetical protein
VNACNKIGHFLKEANPDNYITLILAPLFQGLTGVKCMYGSPLFVRPDGQNPEESARIGSQELCRVSIGIVTSSEA